MLPKIIPRDQHGISRKQISPNALRTLYRLRDHGFAAHLVGGCVRDLLMGRSPKDFDIATDAAPAEIKRLFRNCRLVGRRFRLAHLYFKDGILEVSTFRAAVPENGGDQEEDESRPPRHLKDEEGMVLRDNVFGTAEEDALRRDFTINALAYNIADFSIIDFSTGLSDLEQRIIRPIGDPRVSFTEDPVRMLRAVRFAASHNLTIEAATWDMIRELSSIIARSSPERLYEEVLKLFLLGAAAPTFSLLEQSGLFAAIFPELGRRLQGNEPLRARLISHLSALDERYGTETPPSALLFLTLFFGPVLEEEFSRCERIPLRQDLEALCADFLKTQSQTVNIPGRIGRRVGTLLALQPALQRRPPRRAGRLANHPDFPEALDYLRISAEASEPHRTAWAWWDAFLNRRAVPGNPETSAPVGKKRRRRRRRRTRPDLQVAV